MDGDEKSAAAGREAADSLHRETDRQETKVESETGRDLKKGADRFEERSESSDGRSAGDKQNSG